MKHSIRSLSVVSIAISFCALVSQAQTYPPPYPRDGARKVLENDRVIVWDVTWQKNRPTGMHEHRFDQLSITLAGGVVRVTKLDGTAAVNTSTLGSINLVPAGTVHVEEGLSDVPQRKIMVEIKPSLPVSAAARKDVPGAFPREGAVKLLENDRIAVWDYTWKPGRQAPRHLDNLDSVVVFLEGGTIRSVGDDRGSRETARAAHEVVYSSANPEPYAEAAVVGSPRAVVIELK